MLDRSLARFSPALALTAALLLPGLTGCESKSEEASAEAGVGVDDEYGKALFEAQEFNLGKADSAEGLEGPLVSGLEAETEVWAVEHFWEQITDEAGIAWEASSGLTWDEKFSRWVEGFEKIDAFESSYNKTFELTTPWGKTLEAPELECAETAIFLRATFASWYGLPFYIAAWTPDHGTVYFGHFGIVTKDGSRLPGYPKFATRYSDFTEDFTGAEGSVVVANWPSDGDLRKRFLTTLKDDANGFLGEGAYAGAYFDEVFLNKRAGHFLLRLLTNTGSIHLADARRNTFNLAPTAIRPGDTLLQRWQKKGIGHTVVVTEVHPLEGGRMDVEVMYGSMPRIQPKWYEPEIAKSYFTAAKSGGVGENFDGDLYAKLGGGLKRWRTPVVDGPRWRTVVPVSDLQSWIPSGDLEAIGARTAEFEELLGELTPSEQRDVYLETLEGIRDNLHQSPASCSNRIKREEAFDSLYELEATEFGRDRATVDAEQRLFEDFVFGELVYNQSKTCCWNSSTSDMFEIIMAFNVQHVSDVDEGACQEPMVFKAREGDYTLFADYAAQIGQADAWRPWSADETCPQADVQDDLEAEADEEATPFCDLREGLMAPYASVTE